MEILLVCLQLLVALPIVVASGYLFLLALVAVANRRRPAPAPITPQFRFDFVIPAHNEAAGIAETIASLRAIDYPEALRRTIVVADNCSDDTAQIARNEGAVVLERTNLEQRGKGYALAYAFEQCIRDAKADAVVVVDADTVASKNLLQAFAARLAIGAQAVQAHYGVRNPEASWRTRLMRIALALFHRVRSLAREVMGVSCGLRGNGMCFRLSLIKEVPHDAFSLVEDLEYGIRLGRKGHRVFFAHEADVLGEMVSGEQASRSQRRRWEEGRSIIAKTQGWPLLRDGLFRKNWLLVDLALDVLVPPLSQIVVACVVGIIVCVVALIVFDVGLLALMLLIASLGGLIGYVLSGWLLSEVGPRGLVDLAMAPGYVMWKLLLKVKPGAAKQQAEWIRTTREGKTR